MWKKVGSGNGKECTGDRKKKGPPESALSVGGNRGESGEILWSKKETYTSIKKTKVKKSFKPGAVKRR